jgi:cellulose synthase/poly-beta-1,6-N-acetylglucosamine synthase-like glycosyltransferase
MLAYVYVGYPLFVYAVSLIFPRPVLRSDIEPTVTILITAFNEEAGIREKLENTLQIDYPASKLEIIVASDGSTDGTEEITRQFTDRGVRLVRQEGRVGKTSTQNMAVQMATGDIVLFSDATTLYQKDVLRSLLPNFADETVGCVAGRLIYVDDRQTNVGNGARRYWSYETFIKEAESLACSLIGASGCLYAVRRSAYDAMYAEACSDFLICLNLYRKGLRSVFEPEAVCFEQTNHKAGDELQMRVRVIAQTLTDLWRNRDLLNPLRSGFFAVELVSHKLCRYLVPFLMLVLFLTSFVLAEGSFVYLLALTGQVVLYLSALAGWTLERSGLRLMILVMPLYFVLANLASMIAFFQFFRGRRFASWEPIRPVR